MRVIATPAKSAFWRTKRGEAISQGSPGLNLGYLSLGLLRSLRFLAMMILSLFVLLPNKETPALLQGNRVILVDNSDAGLSIEYDVTAADPFSYFLVPLEGVDLTGMSYLSFWMRPEAGKGTSRIEFRIEFHEDTNGDGKYILGQDRAEGVPVSHFAGKVRREGWQKVVIPLSRFRRIHHWSQILEMAFVFENQWRIGKGRLLVDHLLLGSHYPEGLEAKEIPMQNRVSSFKIGGRIVNPDMKLKRKVSSLVLTLTFIDPYLEEIRFEESEDGGNRWRRVRSFYDHSNGGVYETRWQPPRVRSRQGILLRAMGVNVLGGETELVGPYRIYLN